MPTPIQDSSTDAGNASKPRNGPTTGGNSSARSSTTGAGPSTDTSTQTSATPRTTTTHSFVEDLKKEISFHGVTSNAARSFTRTESSTAAHMNEATTLLEYLKLNEEFNTIAYESESDEFMEIEQDQFAGFDSCGPSGTLFAEEQSTELPMSPDQRRRHLRRQQLKEFGGSLPAIPEQDQEK